MRVISDTQIRLCVIFLVLLTTSACGSSGPFVQRCPAIAPVALECEAWTFDKEAFPESITPIERLQASYQNAVSLLYDAEGAGPDVCGKGPGVDRVLGRVRGLNHHLIKWPENGVREHHQTIPASQISLQSHLLTPTACMLSRSAELPVNRDRVAGNRDRPDVGARLRPLASGNSWFASRYRVARRSQCAAHARPFLLRGLVCLLTPRSTASAN